MSIDSITGQLSSGTQTPRSYWYFLTTALVGGASVIAVALLPRQIAGLSLVLVLVLFSLIDLLARRVSAPTFSSRLRRGAGSVVYVLVLAGVLGTAYALVWAIVRPDGAFWLAWAMAGLVFVVMASGVWMFDGSSTAKKASA